jgi:branched-chain amino acid transport system substrate-binding protein
MIKMGILAKKQFFLGLYLLLFALIGPAMFWLLNNKNQSPQKMEANSWQLSLENLLGFPSNPKVQLSQRISSGDKILITADNSPDKQAGIKAFASKNYNVAIDRFRLSLKLNRNDPESWIYLNNAIATRTKHNIKLAVSVPIGGNLNIAKEILRGVAQFQNEINQKGGINNKHLQIVIANDDNDPTVASQVATEFINDATVLAVIGHNSNGASTAAAPLYQRGKLVMMSPTSAAQRLTDTGKYIFRITPSVRVTANSLAQYVSQVAHRNKVAVCATSKFEVSQSFKEEFIWNLAQEGRRIADVSCDFSDPNFKANDIPSQAIANGADALLLAPSAETINQAIEVMQANRRRLTLFGNQTLHTIETLQTGRENANGLITPVPWHARSFAGSDFPIQAQKSWGGSVSWRTAMAYDATLMLANATKFGATREALQNTLLNPGFIVKGATGVIQFLPTGERSMKGFLMQVQPGKESGIGYDFVAIQKENVLPASDGSGDFPSP